MKKSLTIEDLKERIGKPIFVIALKNDYKKKNGWYVLAKINKFKSEDENTGYIEFTDCNCIHFKNAEEFRLFDTEMSEEELTEILEEKEKKKKKTGYETVGKGEDYFFITSNMKATIEFSYHCNSSVDVARVTCANHFNDETLTINLARAERLRYQLRRYAALNGGISSQEDWANKKIEKYYMCYDYYDAKIDVYVANFYKEFGQIYFKNEEACEKAIKTFKDELLWYFTEFKETLN